MRALLALSLALVATGCMTRTVVEEERIVLDERRVMAEENLNVEASLSQADSAAVEAAVRGVLSAQVGAWNAGDIRGFMDGYWRAREMTFLSGGSVRQGWQDAYYAYVRAYPDRASMGTLTFSDLTVRPLSMRSALVWGRWRLDRGDDAPGGLFTLLFEDVDGEWLVVHDHTSSD